MKTATQAELAQHHGHVPGADEIDPEHEIDERKTKVWFTFFAVFVFATMWLLYILFSVVVQNQRYEHIDRAPTVEKDQQEQWEAETLAGKKGGISIDEAMRRVAR